MLYPVVENVKKIAVLRANALGDFIVILPALTALRQTYPQAEIVLLGKPWHKSFLLPGRTPVDRVIVVPVRHGIRDENRLEDEQDMACFFQDMRDEKFDIAVALQGKGIAANSFLKKLHARITIGTYTEGADLIDRYIPYYYYQSETIRYLEVVKLIGATTADLEPRLALLHEDDEELQLFNLDLPDKKYVLINPGARDTRRMWPTENYVALADALAEKGFMLVFTGSADEVSQCNNIIGAMKHPARHVCGIRLGGLAALTSKAALMIAPDTGPLHLAQATGCATVGLYWAPNVINWAPLTRARHRPVISWRMECPLCGIVPNDPYPFEPMTACRHEVSFIAGITVSDVLKAAHEILEQRESAVTHRELGAPVFR